MFHECPIGGSLADTLQPAGVMRASLLSRSSYFSVHPVHRITNSHCLPPFSSSTIMLYGCTPSYPPQSVFFCRTALRTTYVRKGHRSESASRVAQSSWARKGEIYCEAGEGSRAGGEGGVGRRPSLQEEEEQGEF